jgi:molecular chaperone DnaK (HSP70)
MLLLPLLFSIISSTVIGIDFGTDWLKVSIIKPGGQIETVLNRESKRKTCNVLNIRNGIRSFGVEADTLGMVGYLELLQLNCSCLTAATK